MAPLVVPAADIAAAVDQAAVVLREGGVAVIPTETVYGLVALPEHGDAIDRVFAMKSRPPGMHLQVLVGSAGALELVSNDERPQLAAMIADFWPGPLTLVVPGATALVAGLGNGDGSVGVRCPDHRLARRLCNVVGPIAATSANRHGQLPLTTADELIEAFPSLDLVVDGGELRGGVPSTVLDIRGDEPKVLREGPFPFEMLARTWSRADRT